MGTPATPQGNPFSLFVRVRRFWARAPTTYPPQNRSPWTPPEPLPRQANPSLTPKQHEANRALHVTRSTLQLSKNNTPTLPEPKALDSPEPLPRQANPSLTPSLESRCLVYPVHQASGGYPPPHRASPLFFFLYALETTKIRHTLRNLLRPWAAPTTYPRQPFPDPLSWNQGPWFTPPSTRPALVGTPSPPYRASFNKRHFSFFLYTLETTKIRQTLRNLLHPPPTLSWNRGPWSTPPSTRPAPVGTPAPPHRASFKKRHFTSFCTR